MMNFGQVDEKISKNGFRRHAGTRTEYDENTGAEIKIYDYEHRKKLDMFSVYVNVGGSVEKVEYTNVRYDQQTRKYSQVVTTISNLTDLNKTLAR